MISCVCGNDVPRLRGRGTCDGVAFSIEVRQALPPDTRVGGVARYVPSALGETPTQSIRPAGEHSLRLSRMGERSLCRRPRSEPGSADRSWGVCRASPSTFQLARVVGKVRSGPMRAATAAWQQVDGRGASGAAQLDHESRSEANRQWQARRGLSVYQAKSCSKHGDGALRSPRQIAAGA